MASTRRRSGRLARSIVALSLAVLAALPAALAAGATAPADRFPGLRERLDRQTDLLVGFTTQFSGQGRRYYALARSVSFNYPRLWATHRAEVSRLLLQAKRTWIAGNPLYERMEGIVAGVPALAKYDVIIDAGGSAKEDPASAVPFDLRLPDGRVLRKPGNFYNITEAALWGTDPAFRAPGGVRPDLDGDGLVAFGETLPDAAFMLAATRDFDRYARQLRTAANAYRPTVADAMTALVVMVPTMSEYFGQWKVSRFVAGNRATGANFNVVSRLSDIHDIIGSLQVVYRDVRPLVARASTSQAAQTGRALTNLATFIEDLYQQERSGRRFTAQQAQLLGGEAQERGTAIAGQVSQAAGRLNITIKN